MLGERAFKPGDVVECVDNSHHSNIIALGDRGVVSDPAYEDGFVMILLNKENSPRGWVEYRWKIVGALEMEDTRAYLEAISLAAN